MASQSARRQRHRRLSGRAEELLSDELALAELVDAGTEIVEEGIRRIEEVEGVRPVVHRHDEPRPQFAHDGSCPGAAHGRAVPDRKEEHVDLADRSPLLGAQLGLPEVAEVTNAEAVVRETEDRVRAAPGAGSVIVLGGDTDYFAERRLEGAGGGADDLR